MSGPFARGRDCRNIIQWRIRGWSCLTKRSCVRKCHKVWFSESNILKMWIWGNAMHDTMPENKQRLTASNTLSHSFRCKYIANVVNQNDHVGYHWFNLLYWNLNNKKRILNGEFIQKFISTYLHSIDHFCEEGRNNRVLLLDIHGTRSWERMRWYESVQRMLSYSVWKDLDARRDSHNGRRANDHPMHICDPRRFYRIWNGANRPTSWGGSAAAKSWPTEGDYFYNHHTFLRRGGRNNVTYEYVSIDKLEGYVTAILLKKSISGWLSTLSNDKYIIPGCCITQIICDVCYK